MKYCAYLGGPGMGTGIGNGFEGEFEGWINLEGTMASCYCFLVKRKGKDAAFSNPLDDACCACGS